MRCGRCLCFTLSFRSRAWWLQVSLLHLGSVDIDTAAFWRANKPKGKHCHQGVWDEWFWLLVCTKQFFTDDMYKPTHMNASWALRWVQRWNDHPGWPFGTKTWTSTTSPLPNAKNWSVTPFRCLRLDIYQVSWTCFSDRMGLRSSAGLKWSRPFYCQFGLKRISLSFHVNSFEIWTNLRFLINLSLDCTGLWFQVWLNVQDVGRSAANQTPPPCCRVQKSNHHSRERARPEMHLFQTDGDSIIWESVVFSYCFKIELLASAFQQSALSKQIEGYLIVGQGAVLQPCGFWQCCPGIETIFGAKVPQALASKRGRHVYLAGVTFKFFAAADVCDSNVAFSFKTNISGDVYRPV